MADQHQARVEDTSGDTRHRQFNGYLQQMGIRREFSCTYTLEQNIVAERKNWSVVEVAQAMLEEKGLPKFY